MIDIVENVLKNIDWQERRERRRIVKTVYGSLHVIEFFLDDGVLVMSHDIEVTFEHLATDVKLARLSSLLEPRSSAHAGGIHICAIDMEATHNFKISPDSPLKIPRF